MRLHQARKVNFREGRRLGKDDRLVGSQDSRRRSSRGIMEQSPTAVGLNLGEGWGIIDG